MLLERNNKQTDKKKAPLQRGCKRQGWCPKIESNLLFLLDSNSALSTNCPHPLKNDHIDIKTSPLL